MHEVGELAGLVARKEEPRATHEEDLGSSDARAVDLVVHHDGACKMKRDAPALILELLRGTPIGLAQRAAERHLDARGEIVVVLGLRELGALPRDRECGASRSRADLAEEEE